MNKVKIMAMALLVGLAACKEKKDAAGLLTAREWRLKSMTEKGEEVRLPGELPVLAFTDSMTVHGTAGCNRFFGKYAIEAEKRISLKPEGSTMMACPDMDFEDRYLKALSGIDRFEADSLELSLTGGDGQVRLVYLPAAGAKKIGVAKDSHGCNAAAGYLWSEVRQDCIRLFEEGIRCVAAAGQDSTLAAYVVFAADSLRAELFMPGTEERPLLERRTLPEGGVVWMQEGEGGAEVRLSGGKWVIARDGKVLYAGSLACTDEHE